MSRSGRPVNGKARALRGRGPHGARQQVDDRLLGLQLLFHQDRLDAHPCFLVVHGDHGAGDG